MIVKGLDDLQSSARPTIPALLVSIGAPKLRSLGFRPARVIADPEMKLYELLSREHPGESVHSFYNSLIRRLVSFERAASCGKPQT